MENKRFYCREWVFAKLHHYLQSERGHKGPSGVLITGNAGSGKTAVCRELVSPSGEIASVGGLSQRQSELSSRLAACHFCRRSDAASLEAATFIRSIAQQIASCSLVSAQYARMLDDQEGALAAWLETPRCQREPCEALVRAICQPLHQIAEPSVNLLVLVDSIDCSDGGDFVDLMAQLASGLPKWLLLVCTARRGWRRLAGFRKLGLDDLRRPNVVRDVQQYILGRLDDEKALRRQLDSETAEMLNQLHVKSAGCLLYLQLVLDGVRDGFIGMREIEHIPGTLNGLYLWRCQRVFANGRHFGRVRPILEILLAARQALTKEQMFHAARCRSGDLTPETFSSLLDLLGTMLLEQDGHLLIFHPSFEEWLLDVKYCTQKYLCSPSDGHGSLAMYYASKATELAPTDIVYFAFHLTRSTLSRDLTGQQLASVLIQSGAPVQDLVLNCPVMDEATTRLLLESGADFVNASTDGEADSVLFLGAIEEEVEDEIGKESCPDSALAGPSCSTSTSANTGSISALNKPQIPLTDDSEAMAIEEPLIVAARTGNLEELQRLLSTGEESPNRFGSDGWTPLRAAAWAGHIDCVQALIRKSAVIDHADETRRTALRAAAWSGHSDIVNILVRNGAEVDLKDSDGRTALMAAAYMGHAAIVEQLIDEGADPNICDADGRTALHVCAVCANTHTDDGAHLAVAEVLLRRGASVSVRGGVGGRRPLSLGALGGDWPLCRLLIDSGADPDAIDATADRTPPLLAAAANGHTDVVNGLLERGANSDAIDAEGRTVLTVAAAQGDPLLVGALLRAGVDEMHKDDYGWLPLHHAAFEGRADAAQLLALHNPHSLTHTDHDGRHPLLLAAEEGHLDCCRVLLDAGAPVNLANLEGKTAFRLASANQNASEHAQLVIDLLIERGANIETVDLDGYTPLYALALSGGSEALLERLLRHGARCDCRDGYGRSPLHVAAYTAQTNTAHTLLSYGASIDVQDNDGRTPLMTALWRGNLPTAQFLLQRGADPNAVCQQGASCLGIVAQQGLLEACKLLLRYGADADHKDDYGRSPKDVAEKQGNTQLVILLNQVNTLSPMLGRRDVGGSSPISNNTNSSQNSNEDKTKMTNTSGYNSVGLTASTESPNLNTSRFDHNGNHSQRGVLTQSHINAATFGSTRSSYKSGHSSCKSTLSSDFDVIDATTETNNRGITDEFARKLLERSLPRRNSLLFAQHFSIPLPPPSSALCLEGDNCDDSLSPSFNHSANSTSSSTLQRRSQIATNPKIRKPSGVVLSPDREMKVLVSLSSADRESRL